MAAHLPFVLQLLRFSGVAVVAALVHLGLATLLVAPSHGLPPLAANFLAFLPAVGVSYVGHRWLTFRQPGSLRRFFLLAFAGFSLNNQLLLVALALHVEAPTALVLAALGGPPLMFLGSRKLVFGRRG